MLLKPQAEKPDSHTPCYRTLDFGRVARQLHGQISSVTNLYESLRASVLGGITLLGLLPELIWHRLRAMSKNPLRIVVQRTVENHSSNAGVHGVIYHEILECGHPYSTIPVLDEEFTARRRRCSACGAGLMLRPVPKKPPVAIDMTCQFFGRSECHQDCANCPQYRAASLPPKKTPEPVKVLAKKAGTGQ